MAANQFEVVTILCIAFFITFWAIGSYWTDGYGEISQKPVVESKSIGENKAKVTMMDEEEIVVHRDIEKQRRFYEISRSERLELLQDLYHNRTSEPKRWDALFVGLVPEVSCHSLVRVGAVTGGGKWICRPWSLPTDCGIYSFGMGYEISFERGLQYASKQICTVFIYNETFPNSTKFLEANERLGIHFKESLLEPSLDGEKQGVNIEKELTANGHSTIEIMRITVQAEQLELLEALLKGASLCQLLVEIRSTPRGMVYVLDKLGLARYRLFAHQLYPHDQERAEFSLIHDDCLSNYQVERLADYLMDLHLE